MKFIKFSLFCRINGFLLLCGLVSSFLFISHSQASCLAEYRAGAKKCENMFGCGFHFGHDFDEIIPLLTEIDSGNFDGRAGRIVAWLNHAPAEGAARYEEEKVFRILDKANKDKSICPLDLDRSLVEKWHAAGWTSRRYHNELLNRHILLEYSELISYVEKVYLGKLSDANKIIRKYPEAYVNVRTPKDCQRHYLDSGRKSEKFMSHVTGMRSTRLFRKMLNRINRWIKRPYTEKELVSFYRNALGELKLCPKVITDEEVLFDWIVKTSDWNPLTSFQDKYNYSIKRRTDLHITTLENMAKDARR